MEAMRLLERLEAAALYGFGLKSGHFSFPRKKYDASTKSRCSERWRYKMIYSLGDAVISSVAKEASCRTFHVETLIANVRADKR